MRRSRFARAIETNEARERASIRDALNFDVASHETSDEESLCEWRLTAMQHAPLVLGVTHFLIALAGILLSSSLHYSSISDNPLVSAALVLTVDGAMAAVLLKRHKLNLAPHTVFRILCGYMGLIAALWTWFGHTISDEAFATPIAAAPIAMAAGIAMRAVVAVNSPPLAVVNLLVSTAAASLLATSPLVPAGVALLSMVLFAYSVAAARSFIATGRKRLRLEAQARKAQHFVDEFESSGRGWFWETDYTGTLSYVSDQLAEDFQCDPAELLGRQFTDLLSVDTDASAANKKPSASTSLPASPSRTSWFVRRARRTCTGPCRVTRSSMSEAVSSASAVSAPTSQSSAVPSRRSAASRASIPSRACPTGQ